MHWLLWGSLFLLYSVGLLWVGKKWGKTVSDEALAELERLRAKLGGAVAGSSNPYKKGG